MYAVMLHDNSRSPASTWLGIIQPITCMLLITSCCLLF